jgi:hypothetical protein
MGVKRLGGEGKDVVSERPPVRCDHVWTRNEIEPEIPKSRELISIQPNSDRVFREGKEMV